MTYPYGVINDADTTRNTIVNDYNDAFTEIQESIVEEKNCACFEQNHNVDTLRKICNAFGLIATNEDNKYLLPTYELDDIERTLLKIDIHMYLALKKEEHYITLLPKVINNCVIYEILMELGYRIEGERVSW